LSLREVAAESIKMLTSQLAYLTYIFYYRSTQPGHPSVDRRSENQRKLKPKQTHCTMH